MNEETQKSVAQEQDEKKVEQEFTNPYDLLAKTPNAPSKDVVDQWKKQTPNGIIRIFVLSGNRIFLVRGLSGLELQSIQSVLPANLGAGLTEDAKRAKIEQETNLHIASKGVMWTNTTTDNKVTAEQLRAGSAGLPASLCVLVTYLSDFLDPEALQIMSTEL